MVGNVEHGSIENQQFFYNISEKSNEEKDIHNLRRYIHNQN